MNATNIIKNIIKAESTPAYIFDVDSLQNRIFQIKEIIGDNIKLCYSIKANPFIIPSLLNCIDNLEVCSPGELDICKSLLPDNMNKIIYSGVSKTYDNIKDAFNANVGIYTAESINQVNLINQIAKENALILPVLLRLNAGSQFGMSPKDITYIIHNRDSIFSNCSFEGIHYFAGTQRNNKGFKKQLDELDMLKAFFEQIKNEENFVFRKLEYGPGLPVPLFDNDNFDDTLTPLKTISDKLKEVSKWAELTIEMGRFIATECGYYVTKLLETKNANDTNYAIFDGGINHVNYVGQIMGMKTPIIYHCNSNGELIEDSSEEWNICGSLCTTNDNLIRSYKAGNMNIGDYFIFTNIGAYSVTEGLYLFLSRTLPKIITTDSSFKYKVVRDFKESSIINTSK